MTKPRPAKNTVKFVDEYCETYRDLFPEVRTFEYFKYLHLGMISDIKRKSLPAIADILERDYHYKTHSIIDHQATKQQLEILLNIDLPNLIQTPYSRLIFYFAGHGIALNGDEGPQGYLIPQDGKLGNVSTYLPMQTVETALSKLSCRHCFVILDCCFAGAFRWSSTRRFIHIPKTIHKERYDRFIQDAAWQVITSAGYDQTAFDNLDLKNDRGTAKNQTNHSPFATALMEALQGKADVYPPAKNGKPAGDGIITATELYLYVRDSLEIPTDAIKQRQTPQIWSLSKHDKGEFIFLIPGHPLNLPSAPSLDNLEENNPYPHISHKIGGLAGASATASRNTEALQEGGLTFAFAP